MNMRWDAPRYLLNDTGVKPPGVPRDRGTGFFGTHFLTPETEDSTYYLFAAVRFNRSHGANHSTARFIKAQQANIRKTPYPLKPVLFDIDAGPARYKRILEAMMHEAQEHATRS
jgi:vanillate O-demethylase monooxygenase subunit